MSIPPIYVSIIGRHGSGKSTLAKCLVHEFNAKHISTGDVLRKLAEKNIDVSIKIQNGELIDDDLVCDAVKKEVGKTRLGLRQRLIFDGFPRTLKQAKWLEDFLNKRGKSLDKVIALLCSSSHAKDIVEGRQFCSGDNNPNCKAIFHKRIELHRPRKEDICDLCKSPLIQRLDDQDPKVVEKREEGYLHNNEAILKYYESDEYKKAHNTELVKISLVSPDLFGYLKLNPLKIVREMFEKFGYDEKGILKVQRFIAELIFSQTFRSAEYYPKRPRRPNK